MVPNKGPEIYPPNVKLDADPPRFYNSTTMKSAQFQCGQSGRIYGKMQRATGGDRHTGQERPLSQGEVIIIQFKSMQTTILLCISSTSSRWPDSYLKA